MWEAFEPLLYITESFWVSNYSINVAKSYTYIMLISRNSVTLHQTLLVALRAHPDVAQVE